MKKGSKNVGEGPGMGLPGGGPRAAAGRCWTIRPGSRAALRCGAPREGGVFAHQRPSGTMQCHKCDCRLPLVSETPIDGRHVNGRIRVALRGL